MRRLFIAATLTLLTLAFPGLSAADTTYSCSPCGCPSDNLVFYEPGPCPGCGMQLVQTDARLNVAILVFDNMQILDFAGPVDVLVTRAEDLDVYTVGFAAKPVTATGGLIVTPSFGFSDAPEADILIVPGGNVGQASSHAPTIAWVKSQSEKADHVLSVCTGSFILAKTGLLENQKSTTYHTALDHFQRSYPSIDVVSDQRWVDNGKFMSSAGISSGIDATLHLVEKIFGRPEAQATALDLEYDWDPAAHYVRAALPDLQIPDLGVGSSADCELTRNEEDSSRWHTGGKLTLPTDLASLQADIEKGLKSASIYEPDISQGDGSFRLAYSTGEAQQWQQLIEVSEEKEGMFRFDIHVTNAPKEHLSDRVEIAEVVDSFARSLTTKDKDLFLSLFNDESPSWIGASEPILREGTFLQRPEHRGIYESNHTDFIDWICESPDQLEERCQNVEIVHDDAVGNVTFDFTFESNGEVTNWGKESWQLVNNTAGWKICSVVFTLTNTSSNPFPNGD